ncbi:hypothetical protein X975_07440, partial [Stegodyphus mimosarum]
MDLETELFISYSCPEVYKAHIDTLPFEEVLQTYCEILEGSSFSDAESVLVFYVTTIVEPVGWKAVWRSTKKSSLLDSEYDFVVEVVNVSLEKLEADIYVKSIIIGNFTEIPDLKKVKFDRLLTVPLIELYTISEDDEEASYAKTAVAIERVRFFYNHLSRPWDGEEDIRYSEEILKPRLQLYFDMKNNALPKAMTAKINSILKEGWRILDELKSLYTDMNISDSEAEINEEDLLQSMSLRAKLSEFQQKMEIIENPILRSFVMKKYVPSKSRQQPKTQPVVFVVAKQFTYDMIMNLPTGLTTVLEFEHSPEAAFKLSSSGDKILIFPGVYQCDSLGWLEGNILVQGLGSCSDIVVEATGNSEVFINCCAQNLKIENISLKAKKGLLSVLVVHHGRLNLNNCIIDSNKADIGLLLLGGAEVFLEDCVVCNSLEDGIQMRSLTSFQMKTSEITDCERHGIQIDAEDLNSADSFTELSILSSQITGNGGHGILLNNVPINEIALQRPEGE